LAKNKPKVGAGAIFSQNLLCRGGYWNLYTFDPRKDQPLELVSKALEGSIKDLRVEAESFCYVPSCESGGV